MPASRVAVAGNWPPRVIIRQAAGLRTLESALIRSGLGPVAGVDEAGRGGLRWTAGCCGVCARPQAPAGARRPQRLQETH